MTDVAESSSKVSSLYQALTKTHSSDDYYSHKMKPSVPAQFRECVTLTPESGSVSTNGGEVTFSLTRSGLMQDAYCKITLSGMDLSGYHLVGDPTVTANTFTAGTVTAHGINFAKNIGAYVEEMSLRTHSRILSSIPGAVIQAIVDASPHAEILNYMAAGHTVGFENPTKADDDYLGLKATSRLDSWEGVTIMVPCPFSCFRNNDFSNPLPTSFCEQLQLVIKMKKSTCYAKPVDGGDTGPTTIKMELVSVASNLFSEPYRKYITENFVPGKSSQQLWSRAYEVGRMNLDASGQAKWGVNSVDTISTTQTGVCRTFIICAEPQSNVDSASFHSDDYLEIAGARFSASGRTLIDIDQDSAQCLSITSRPGSKTVSKCWVLDLAHSGNDPSYFSGGLATAGLSSQRWDIKVKVRTGKYIVRVFAIEYAVISISSDSGAVLGALST